MINADKIVYGVADYFVPGRSGARAVSILKRFDDGDVLVQPYSFDKDLRPFAMPIEFVYNKSKDAERGKRGWENYMRSRKKQRS